MQITKVIVAEAAKAHKKSSWEYNESNEESFILGAKFVYNIIKKQLVDVKERLPDIIMPVVYVTKNNAIGLCKNRLLDQWFVDKFQITRWMPLTDLLEGYNGIEL